MRIPEIVTNWLSPASDVETASTIAQVSAVVCVAAGILRSAPLSCTAAAINCTATLYVALNALENDRTLRNSPCVASAIAAFGVTIGALYTAEATLKENEVFDNWPNAQYFVPGLMLAPVSPEPMTEEDATSAGLWISFLPRVVLLQFFGCENKTAATTDLFVQGLFCGLGAAASHLIVNNRSDCRISSRPLRIAIASKGAAYSFTYLSKKLAERNWTRAAAVSTRLAAYAHSLGTIAGTVYLGWALGIGIKSLANRFAG